MSFVKSTALNVRRPKHFFLNSIFPSLISLACPCNYDILCVLKSNFKCTKYIAKYTFCHTINKLHYCDKNYFIASLMNLMWSAIYGIKNLNQNEKTILMELSWHLKGTVMNTRFYKWGCYKSSCAHHPFVTAMHKWWAWSFETLSSQVAWENKTENELSSWLVQTTDTHHSLS